MKRFGSIRTGLASRFLAGALALVCVAPAAADDALRQIDLTISPGQDYTQRFSWLHWWETQRPAIQRQAMGERHTAWAVSRLAAVEPYRAQLIETLVPLIKDVEQDPYARAGAVLALARLRYEKLTELIVSDDPPPAGAEVRVGPSGQSWPVGLIGDEHVRVRVSAWIALGLLDTEDSRALLMDEFAWAVTEDDQIARLTAFGFLSGLPDAEREFLMTTMRNSETAEVQRVALWALDQHDSEANDAVMRAAITELRSPYSVSEALLAAGPMQRMQTHPLMQRILAQPNQLDELTVFNHIERGTVWQSTCTFGVLEQLQVSAMLALTEMQPTTGETAHTIRTALERKLLTVPTMPRPTNGERVERPRYADYQRGPAALALAMQTQGGYDLNDNVRTLVKAMEGVTEREVWRYPLDEQGRPCTDQTPVLVAEETVLRGHPVRGYAAVAAGLLIQRMNPDTALGQERPIQPRSAGQLRNVVGDLTRPMIKALHDSSEHMDVRCASAIGLGLTGMPGYREPLRKELDQLGPQDLALYGYIVEALAMLGDPDVPQLAERYLEQADEVQHDNDLLGRRALLSAITISGETSDEIDALLMEAWPHSPWVGLAAARASSAKGGGAMIGYLLERLEDPWTAPAAAMSLAEVVDMQSPWRMSRLTQDINYTLDYRVPINVGWNPYVPDDQVPLPTRLVAGLDNAYLMHNLLIRRLPDGATMANMQNDDSNGMGHFLFADNASE